MVRMILSHPRSRSHLLGSVYSNYRDELFTPEYIKNTEFFRHNKDLLDDGHGFDSTFARKYVEYLRDTMKGQDFTFKVHFCDINGWRDAQALIEEWAPTEIVSIERVDKKQALFSLLLADKMGYASFRQSPGHPFIVTDEHFAFSFKRVVTDWFAGLKVYKPDLTFQYECLDQQLRSAFFGDDRTTYEEWKSNLRFKDQRSKDRLYLIANMNHVLDLWCQALEKMNEDESDQSTR